MKALLSFLRRVTQRENLDFVSGAPSFKTLDRVLFLILAVIGLSIAGAFSVSVKQTVEAPGVFILEDGAKPAVARATAGRARSQSTSSMVEAVVIDVPMLKFDAGGIPSGR